MITLSGVDLEISLIPIIIKTFAGFNNTISSSLANTPKVLSLETPLFFTFIFLNISDHSPISVILSPKKTMAFFVFGDSLNNVSFWP